VLTTTEQKKLNALLTKLIAGLYRQKRSERGQSTNLVLRCFVGPLDGVASKKIQGL
jgi:hypothetical protein